MNSSTIHIYNTPLILTGNPEIQFTYKGSDFVYFTIHPDVDWYAAQLSCLYWGGNLATIQSAVEDNLLFYSITDFVNRYSCHIGLNDIQHDAGTDENAFVWVDGSNSTYRNFGTLVVEYPVSDENHDCVRARYRNTFEILSQGWVNAECTTSRGCYYCSKPGMYVHYNHANKYKKISVITEYIYIQFYIINRISHTFTAKGPDIFGNFRENLVEFWIQKGLFLATVLQLDSSV